MLIRLNRIRDKFDGGISLAANQLLNRMINTHGVHAAIHIDLVGDEDEADHRTLYSTLKRLEDGKIKLIRT